MDSSANNSRHNAMSSEYDHAASASTSPATAEMTTISTIVLQSHPIQIVVGLLQSKNNLHIKIVEIAPKLQFLGANIEETVQLQNEHEAVYRKLQNQATPIEEFSVKAEQLLAEKRANPQLLDAMAHSLTIAWRDLLKIFEQRRHVLHVNGNFHEKIGICMGKMGALEVACRDTMLPNEIEAIQEFLNKFKQLRIDVLASVMVTLKEGNELLASLRETAMGGQLDVRPDSIKVEIKKSMSQVELWLEQLHDRRNELEQAWQTRKTQLEQCLAFAMLMRDINELQQQVRRLKEIYDQRNHQLDCEANATAAHAEVVEWKTDAVVIRDRALKITRSTEKLSSTCRFDNNSNNKAYMFLNECTELVEDLDNYEELLSKIVAFYEKAEKTLTALRQLETESSNLIKEKMLEKYTLTRLINDTAALVEEPLRLGYALLDRIGRSNPEAFGIEKTVVEIENRRIYLEEFYSQHNLEYIKITETLNEFYESCNSISAWLVSVNKAFLTSNNSMGRTLEEGKLFLQLHHQMLSDLEAKGSEINKLLVSTSQVLESIDKGERDEIEKRIQTLRDSWDVIKTIVENRVDLSTNFIKFLQLADKLGEMFDCVEQILQSPPDESKLNQMDELWAKISSAYTQLKDDGNSFVEHISMVVDDTLEKQTTRKCVEQILTDFSLRQHRITESWERWTTIIRERREIEHILQQIMSKNELSLISASKLDAQLYPILMKQTTDLNVLKAFLHDKLHLFLADIEKAQIEITHHIQTTAALQPKDDKTIDKVTQVLRNLNAIVNKLASIKNDFHSLIDGIVDFIESLITTKNSIELYFNQMSLSADLKNIDGRILENEQFTHRIEQELRLLMEHQNRLIEQINKQEPFEAKDHDINFIKTLLNNIKHEFEGNNSMLMNRIKSEADVERFKTNFKSIFDEIDRLKVQLNNTQTELKETLLTSNAKYLSYESYEHTIQILDQRIDQFINTSENVCNNNSDAKPFIQNSISELKRYWNDLKRQANELRQNIDNTKHYFAVNEQIDRFYRDHREYLQTIINQMSFTKQAHETYDLINKIDRYISDHESRQLELLKELAAQSKNVYGYDKTIEKYSENIELFQSFFSTKNQLNQLGEHLAEEEKAKAAAEELQRKQELEKQQQQQQQQQQQKRDQIQLTQHNETVTETVDFVSRPYIQRAEVVDIKVIGTHQTLALDEPPRFIRPLCDVTVQEGERCRFVCELQNAQATIHIEWLKDGIPITSYPHYIVHNENGLCTLSIDETFTEDSATFTCRATNHLGTIETSGRLFIQHHSEQTEMLFPPHFVSPLTNCKTVSGSTVLWKCFVEGNPLPTIQWYKNDVCIDVLPRYNILYNNGEATIRMDDLSVNDAGIFTCIAKNILGVDQCSATLTVAAAPQSIDYSLVKNAEADSILQSHHQQIHHIRPEFRTPLTNIVAAVGQTIELDCELVGDPKPNIFWKINGKPLLISDRVKLQHDHDRVKLQINEAQAKDAGNYTLCAKNIAGLAYSSCDVAVQLEMTVDTEAIKPTVLLPLKDVHAIEGKSVQLQCEISGSPEPEVIWYHENKPIKESSDVQLLFRGDRCSLFIQEAYLEDMGEYKVVAINSAGEASSICKLTVKPLNETDPAKRSTATVINTIDGFAPRFEKLLCDILVNEGETIELDCVVVGKPKPTIKWFLSNTEIHESDHIQFAYSADDGKAKLILKNVTNDDKGVYTVQATNSLGDAKCFSHLIVKSINATENLPDKQAESEESHHFLTFKEKFINKTACIGDTVKFECIVVGKPTPKIRWLFNDRPVQGKNFLASTSGDRQVLTIPSTSHETIGKISCAAENDFHRESCSAYLNLAPDFAPPSSQRTEHYTEEYDAGSSNVTIKKQSAITTQSTSQTTSYQNGAPQPITVAVSDGQSENLVSFGTNEVTELKKSMLSQSKFVQSTENLFPKSIRKEIAPRFITPFIGKIIEQGTNITLETVVDGFPTPEIQLTKNGEPLFEKENLSILRKNNRITISIQNVTSADAGRYSCSATNTIGNALSTADIVVKKSIFPPVFGHRLQAKVAKSGERVVMDIEVSGIPEPNVTWYKDDKPLNETKISTHKILSSGNSHTLVIEKVCKEDGGKYMVKAVNDAGETHSIADFIILEASPERIDIVKTVTVENIEGPRAMNEINAPANKPNSYHSSQTETVTQSDTHGSSEQTIHTETCRITETTMRMEHKSPLPDIEFNPSPKPFESKECVDIHTTLTDCMQAKSLTDLVTIPQHQYQHQQTEHQQTEHDHLVATKTFENIKYTTYETATATEPQYIANDNLYQNNAPLNGDALTKTKYSSVSDRVKTIEKSGNDDPHFSPYKTIPIWNPSNESPISQYNFDKQSQRAISITPTLPNGICSPNPLNDTIEKISNKMQEYEQHHWSNQYDLKAPALVKHVMPITKPYENGVQSQEKTPLHLEPGEPPELCFAPRTGERKQSLVEKLEKSLEKDLERGPSKVLPHSVRMMPPSPQTVSTEQFESSKRIYNKQTTQHDINHTNKDINHIKNIFYEHNKPLHRNTFDHVPSPTKAPEKNQFNTSVCSNVSFNAEGNKTTDEYMSHRSSSVRFKESEFDRSDSSKGHPIWRPAYESDTDTPHYRPIKPILTPTTGRSSAISIGASPIPPSEFEKPQRFTPASEQLTTVTREFQVLKPKAVSARPLSNQSKPFSSSSSAHSPQFYTAVAGPPYHNQRQISEASSHMEMHESMESSQHIMTSSSTRKVITFDQQQQHQSQNTVDKPLEPFPFTVSPTPSMTRQKLRPPPTPTKFIPGEFRESDYDSEIESIKIRPIWTPNQLESERIHYRHVSPPTPSRCTSVPRHHFERILTPMEFDVNTVEMPTTIKGHLPSPSPPYDRSQPAYQFKTQTLDRFRSKKKTSSHFTTTTQDDINIMHSIPKHSRIRSPAQQYHQEEPQTCPTYREESRSSQYVHGSDNQFSQGGLVYQSQNPSDISPPVFEKIFKNARFAQGGNALFEGKLRGNPKPAVSWTRKGAPLLASNKYQIIYNENTGDVSLLINQIGPGDEGEYTCTARNQYGEAICSVHIQPEGQPLPPMQNVHQQFYRQSNQMNNQYSNGYSFTSIHEEFKVDTFEYRILRETSFRESVTRRNVGEHDFNLNYEVDRSLGPATPPQITQKPRNSKLVEGSDATFSAKVGSNPRPRLTWFKDGQRLIENNKYETIYSNNQATLRIRSSNANDSGHYTLLAENPQGCVVSSAVLAIEPAQEQPVYRQPDAQAELLEQGKALAPSFIRVFDNREVTEGKMTRFDCRITGRPFPEVFWFINDKQVQDDATHKILVNESGNHSLMITNVSRYDAGTVTCLARNKAGEVAIQAQLGVVEKEQMVAPKFVERFTTVNVREGEPVQLTARAIGTPVPRITWQKDGSSLTPHQNLYISVDGGATALDIPRATAADAGWYQCTAQNVAGSTATRARLYVQLPKEPTPEQRRLYFPRPTKIIEPELEPEPEVIYLRHVERARPHARPDDGDRVYPPPQFIVPLQDVTQTEGGKIHFEGRIEPVGDPTMYVEWFLNGRPLAASSRSTYTFKFGFIALDLLSIIAEDGGEYVCRVTSSTGVAESRAILRVTQRSTIEKSSQNPNSLQYIQQLEDYSKYQRTESLDESVNQKPAFIRPLRNLGQLEEGRNAHFEGQLTPVNDSTMKVEWYKDGRPITASSRITAIFNFGYVSLNIMHLRAEDAGSYTARAVNRLGEAISTSTLQVFTRNTVTADLGIPEQQRYIESVEELETHQRQQQQKYVQEIPESVAPPVFKTPIKDQLNIRENGFAHFEARLEPVGDSTLKVEWFKDGHPVKASSRITSFFNFGYVALTIKQVTVHDVGIYTCRATNALAQASTSAKITVVTKDDISFDSAHPSGLEKIQQLEDTSRYSRKADEDVQIMQKPRFLGPLKGTNKILEGQRAHFEARVEPQNDLNLKIEWNHNGKPIMPANRIQIYHDFGYVALDILSVRAEDAGVFTVVAKNQLGEEQLSAQMIVETRSSIDTSSMHKGIYEKTQKLESSKFVEPQYEIEEISKSKPYFVQPLSDPKPVNEGKNIHLECRLEPLGDPTMRVEWFHNGKPITIGSRFRTYYDFGFVALDIIHASTLDSGEYTVRATNHLGSAHTSSCVRVIGRSDILTDTQNEMSLEQIQMLEDASRRQHQTAEEITILQAPQFTRPLHNIETVEGTNVHLECRLQPVGDPTMRVEWFVNGHPLKFGHRFRPAHDFDYVALDLLGVYAVDSGVYTCQARNQLGEAVTSCSVRVIAQKDLITETQNKSGLEKIQYLEDSSRYKRTEYVDEQSNIRPRFLTKPKDIKNLREGQHAHFECKLEPVTDSNLKVEWFKNGRPVTIGHRFRPIHDFGYVALDIIDLIAEDSGCYTCRAANLVGVDETTCNLDCRSSQQILTTTQNEAGLEQIQYLEDRSKYHRTESHEEVTKQAPVFTTSLKNVDIKEGQRAHFECRLIPVSDPTMKVEWYHNNQPLKSGSRFTETNNFGFVALDILSCLPEDSGTYTARAINALGEAVTSAISTVTTRKAIYTESQHEGALRSINHLEDTSRHQTRSVQDEIITQAPVFTMPVRDIRVAENQAVHFEARLIPVGDPKLKVEWLRNGVPLEASNRLTTMHDFGYVALNMKYVNPEDSGSYVCRATNELGQAVTSASLIVQSKAALQMETQNESALQKIHQLEDTSRYQRREEEDTIVRQAPRFVTQLNGPTNLHEGQSAHYECRIEPYPDSNLKVEWFHNDKPLQSGHRFRTTYDFGFAALDILSVYAEDSGSYVCRVTNLNGEATSSVKLGVQPRASIVYETQNDSALEKIHYLEGDQRYKRKADDDLVVLEKPEFGRPLRNAAVQEGKPVHLEATLTPVNDPTMVVEWFCNGKPIQQGHRFKTTYDFGFVALDILYAHSEDTGTYMCKAKNAVGEAITTCSVSAAANAGLFLDTLDEQRLQKIRQLESYQKPKTPEVEEVGQKPVFLTPLTSLEHLKEGDHAHLECRVEPIGDQNLRIEWYRNGKLLTAGHRYRTTHDFGYVALDILYVYGEDTGTYMCKAVNKLGEAMNTCNIRCLNRKSIILDTQHPDGLEKIQKLESRGAQTRNEIAEIPITPPRFTTNLHGTTEILEGQTAHFEAQVEPIHDSNLKIEFYHNGKLLQSASRFHTTFDFGYISLDIQKAVSEDAGEYMVRAYNALGESRSTIRLNVIAKGSIITESQRPEGLEKIRQLELGTPHTRPEVPEPVTRQRPVFTQPLQNIDSIAESQTAHFECRLIPVGDPTLRVEWYRNEKLIEDSSRITKQHDFGFVSMDISHIRAEDQGVYMCRAINALGEAVTTAAMKIRTQASIQMDTQHPESIPKLQQLEQPARSAMPEPERVFEKPIFTQLLNGPAELWEGQHAHFEARVVPVGDPTMRYEWYVNGVELKMGSRFRTSHDFGFVSLDISSVVAEDSGIYMCRAINNAGEAVSSTGMKVKGKASIVGDTLSPESWQQIQLKEAAMNRVPEMFVDQTPQQAPVFTTHLQSYEKLVEGQNIQLEAQVEPRADPNLKIEWFKNGIPLTTGSRIRSTFDFGLVILQINSLRDDDSGIYTCRATNLVGEAVSTSSIKVGDRHWLLGDTLHPGALPRIAQLEEPKPGRPEMPEPAYESPVFISHLNNIECKENDNVRFECNVEPARDPTMQIEWFFNNKPLTAGSKYKTTHDLGYVALDIISTYAENSGIYTCRATNSKGTATTSGTLRCIGAQTMFLDTQHPQGQTGLEAVQETEEALANRYARDVIKPEKDYPAPVWTKPLEPEFRLNENQALHLEGQVEPKEDPNLKIEWFFNGKVLQHGSRFKMNSEFGFVTLDLTDVYERDQGIYTCKATNKKGEAFTTSTIVCTGKESIIERTQHPKGAEGLETIQNLEDSLRKPDETGQQDEIGQAPRFTTEFITIPNIAEGEIAHFDAMLVPTGDQSMVVEWFYNGNVLEASHRFKTVYAFGMVVLEIIGTKIEDSGTYACRASNKFGTAEISTHLTCVERLAGQPPKFTTQIQNLAGLKDGQSAHFECTLIPVNDPELKVEWYHNGKPIRHSTRIKPVSDFGYVLLDIAYVQSHDSGEYVCRAWNKYGEDFTRGSIDCFGKGGVFYDSLQPQSLERIRELEGLGAQQPQAPPTPTGEAPRFITQLQDIAKLVEGQSAHLEARLTPTNDPDLVVEWYYNGKKLPHGHRFRTFHDFGIVILDILYCYEENSGEYECRATNKYGTAVTKASLRCYSKTNLVLDSQLPRGMEGGLEKIQDLEDSHIRTKEEIIEETKGKAPVFTVPLSNVDSLREGENVHFEARVTPTDDPKLRIEWYWNGKPLKTGSRFRTFCDFGFVILEISPVYPEDSGEYACRALNEYGEAVTTASMKVQGKRSIILESQLPKGMEGTIDRIAELEGLGVQYGEQTPEEETGKPPEFITSPVDLTINENGLAHFECRLTPIHDPSLQVEWYHNGKALWSGSRIKTINDFGFVILEIAGCYQRDSGLYTCKATNKHGEATVSCKLQVKGRQGIIMEPQLPSNFRTGTESLQKLEENLHKREEIFVDEEEAHPPKFVVDIADNVDVPEGGPVHFDCRVEPVGDPSMRIDWFHNGRPLNTGSRVHQLNDFGFIALDIDYIYQRDSGEYTCRATNKWGTAMTKATVNCIGKQGIISESQLPQGMTAEHLKDLERGPVTEPAPEEAPLGPPKFITHIKSATVEESESIRFECRVEPKKDPKLRIEWYRNGKLLPSGHRYRNVYDLGFVSLDILYVYAEDSGEYVCRAVNEFGEDFTKATISCKQLPSIILQNQVPKGMKTSETLMQMEAAIKKYTSEVFLTEDDLYDADKKQPPRFVTQIKDQTTLVEMQATKFECQLAPVGDPNMKVEWFFNGKPLHHKNRFEPIYDFGYVAMNFGWVYPEDSGEYVCRATNLYGQDETRAIIKTSGKPGIIYDSQLPKHMKSIDKIRAMEASWQVVPEEPDEDAKPKTAPIFVHKPESVQVEEGEWARFCVRVTGHPRPRVMWLLNGHTIVNGSRFKLTYDGMYHMDIPKTRQYDTGKIEVIARSSIGETLETCELQVVPRSDDYRNVLKNSPRPWYDSDLVSYQKDRQETELEKTFEDRRQYLAEQGGVSVGQHFTKTKQDVKEVPEWQKSVQQKKTESYYNKLQELETDQLLRETKLREESHQYAIPGEKIVNKSMAKGMAQKYQEQLEKTEDVVDTSTKTVRKVQQQQPMQPSESSVHGREVYVNRQKQTQKETVGDVEITRKITATETTEVEHKGTAQERVVEGPVQPSTAPFFTKKIQPCRAYENEQARFEVEYDGDPIPKVQWYRENFPIQNSPVFQIHTFGTKSILMIRQVFLEDSAMFSVIAENRGGTAKCSANLVVQERKRPGKGAVVPPSFLATAQDTTVNEGQLARFDAKINGTKPLDVYWLKNGKKIEPNIKYKIVEEDNTYTLLIIEAFQEDAGAYECVAVNSTGEARCEAECTVVSSKTATKKPQQSVPGTEKTPTLVEPLKDQVISEGSSIVFKCRVIGKPTPTAQWFKGPNIIKPSKFFQMSRDGEYYSLRITEAFPEDEGAYKCELANSLGKITTSANLRVQAPEMQEALPTLSAMKDVVVQEGSPAQFKTTISGKTKPTNVQWFREGALIPESPDFQMIFDGNNAVLLIATTYEEDSGLFTCRVTSSAGQVKTSAKLIVKSKK